MTNLRVRDAAQEQVSLADVYESELSLDELKLLVKVTGLKNPGQLKSQKAASMALAMSGDALQALWSRLDNTQQLAVAETVHSAAPQFDKSRFTAKYDKAPLWSTDGKSSYSWRSSPSLLCAFLIGPKRLLPNALRDRLLAFVDEPEPMATGGAAALPPTYELTTTEYDHTNRTHVTVTNQIPISVHVREYAAQRELLSVLRLVDAGKISVSDKTKKPTGASMTAITNAIGGDFYAPPNDNDNEQRDEPGAIRAFAWPMLVQAAGLAKPSPTKLTLTKTGRSALDRPAAETLRDIWDRWLNAKLFDELARIDAVKGQNGKARRGLSQAVDRRALVQRRLRDCDPGEWLETKFILRFLSLPEPCPLSCAPRWPLGRSISEIHSMDRSDTTDTSDP